MSQNSEIYPLMKGKSGTIMANFVTLIRVLLAIFSLYLLPISLFANRAGIILIVFSLLLDMVDGALARHLKTSSFKGSIYDILGDRLIENLFFIYYASLSFFSVWIAMLIMLRGITIDALRAIQTRQGRTAFGPTSWHTQKWIKWLVCSRFSRGCYNGSKLITFITFAFLMHPDPFLYDRVKQIAYFSLWLTILLSLMRAIPVIFDGWILQTKHNHSTQDVGLITSSTEDQAANMAHTQR